MRNHWNFHHVGIPVWDLDQAIQVYRTLGFQFPDAEFLIDSSLNEEYLVYGKSPDPKVLTRGVIGNNGSMTIELLQPVQGQTVHLEKLESSGEGVGHFAYLVKDLEAEVSMLQEEGHSIILSVTPKGHSQRAAVYVDTRKTLNNLIVELIQDPQSD